MGCNSSKQIYSKQIYSKPEFDEIDFEVDEIDFEVEMAARINFITRINAYDCSSNNEPYYKYIEHCYSMYKLELLKF